MRKDGGKGGKMITHITVNKVWLQDGDSTQVKRVNIALMDSAGHVIGFDYTDTWEDGSQFRTVNTENEYNGVNTSTTTRTIKDPQGQEYYHETDIESSPVHLTKPPKRSRKRTYTKDGIKHKETYNYEKDMWEDSGQTSVPQPIPGNTAPASSQAEPIEADIGTAKNCIYVGPAAMYEDYQSSSYTALGAEAGYSRAISNKTGIAINTGVYFHKDMNQYSSESIQQVNVGAGIVYFPFRQEGGSENTFDFSVHLYAGFANLKSTITEKINGSDSGYTSSLSYSNSQTGFALTAGVAVDLNLSQHISLELPIDYAPTFFKQEYYTHKIQNNFRGSIGIVFKL